MQHGKIVPAIPQKLYPFAMLLGWVADQGWGKLAIFGQIKRNEPLFQPKWNQKKVKSNVA